MGHAWVNITYMTDDEFKAEQELRNRKAPVTNTASLR